MQPAFFTTYSHQLQECCHMTQCEVTTKSLNHPNHAFSLRFLFVCLLEFPSIISSLLAGLTSRQVTSFRHCPSRCPSTKMDGKSQETLTLGGSKTLRKSPSFAASKGKSVSWIQDIFNELILGSQVQSMYGLFTYMNNEWLIFYGFHV